jgi:hypothetical protein
MSNPSTPPTDGENLNAIFLDTATEYKIGKITYRVTAHYADSGDNLKTKITRLLKQDTEFELREDLTRPDK